MSKRYLVLKGGPYEGMRRRNDKLPTFTFTAKGLKGFYSKVGTWININSSPSK